MTRGTPPGQSILLSPALALALLAGGAQAQINSPPRPLQGQPSYHLYSVPGVMNNVVASFFQCPNTTSANIRVGVEVFSKWGGAAINDASASSLDLAAGGGSLFGTNSTTWVTVDSNLGPGPISTGSARILATNRGGIICTAFIADPVNAPPTSMAQLNTIKKTKQKGGLAACLASGDQGGNLIMLVLDMLDVLIGLVRIRAQLSHPGRLYRRA